MYVLVTWLSTAAKVSERSKQIPLTRRSADDQHQRIPSHPIQTRRRKPKRKKVSTHWLYIAVIVAVVAGTAVGLIFGKDAAGLAIIGTAFVNLIKMMIGPIIFCTIVLGIGSVRKASQVGKVGGLALLYFITMSTFALFLGLLVGNLITPGDSSRRRRPRPRTRCPR